MVTQNINPKINLILFLPLTFFAVVNGVVFHYMERPILMIANFMIYGIVVLLTRLVTKNFVHSISSAVEMMSENNDAITYSAALLNKELGARDHNDLAQLSSLIDDVTGKSDALGALYQKLKVILVMSVKAEQLALSKELAKVCQETGALEAEVRDLAMSLNHIVSNLPDHLHTEKPLMISENIQIKLLRLNLRLIELGILKHDPVTVSELPLRPGALRKAIRLAEKRAA